MSAGKISVVIITQNDPFYLPECIRYLLSRLPPCVQVKGAVVLGVSPFGRSKSIWTKVWTTIRLFGPFFFFRYSWKWLIGRVFGKTLKERLVASKVPIIDIEGGINSKDSLRKISQLQPDVVVSIAGNEIFRRPLIDIPKYGIINLHTAKLPLYRGLMPSFWVLANMEEETAVSVFFVDEGIDSGPILVQESLRIAGRTQEELIRDTKVLGMEAIRMALVKIANGDIETMPNDESKSTYFGFPTREDVERFRAAGAKFF